jgi:hypothetical protein
LFLFSSTECNTPNLEKGVCIDVKSCPKLLNLIKNQRHVPSVLDYLRKSICGFEGKIRKTCCALESNETTVPPYEEVTNENTDSDLKLRIPLETTCGISNYTHRRTLEGAPSELGKYLKK